MSFDRLRGAIRLFGALIIILSLAGCGGGAMPALTTGAEAPSHNKLATKVLADIAVARVGGAMPSRVARRRGREML